MRSAIYEGRVVHHRTGSRGEHRFSQRITWFALWLDELDELSKLRLFGVNRFAPFALHDEDHGQRDGSPWRNGLDDCMSACGLAPAHRYQALCVPRILGYGFNPITVVIGWDENATPVAVLYEVHNTFGQAHTYVHVLDPAARPPRAFVHESDKALRVSPFFSMHGHYTFRLNVPDARFGLSIRYEDADGGCLDAAFVGYQRALTDGALLGLLLRAPLAAITVTAGIHWQALRLWLKGVPLYPASGSCTAEDRAKEREV